MRADAEALYKHRTIQFCRFHPEPDQVCSAATWLQGVAGIQAIQAPSRVRADIIQSL